MKQETAIRASKIFTNLSSKLIRFRPALRAEIAQTELGIPEIEYMNISILTLFYMLGLFFALVIVLYLVIPDVVQELFIIIMPAGIIFAVVMALQSLFYPRLLLKKKADELNKDLLFALRHMLIQIRSGVPLYNALVSVSQADYGEISKEFRRAAKEINAGGSQTDALDNMVLRTPSPYLRRAIWQMSNALRAGSDLAQVLELLVVQFSAEEKVNIQRFSRELAPWALMYLMLTVIFPTMGVAMLLVLTTISPIVVTDFMFIIFIVLFTVFQFFFIKFLKNKRPKLRF